MKQLTIEKYFKQVLHTGLLSDNEQVTADGDTVQAHKRKKKKVCLVTAFYYLLNHSSIAANLMVLACICMACQHSISLQSISGAKLATTLLNP